MTRRLLDALLILYARISLDRQDGAGVERQTEDATALAAGSYPGQDVLPFIDNSRSAWRKNAKRPQYDAMMLAVREAVAEGRKVVIFVWKIDRLYRKPPELEELIGLAEEGAVTVLAVTEGDYDLRTPDGAYRARIAVAAAARESAVKSERTKRAKAQARRRGLSGGGPRPFGWLAVPATDSVGRPTDRMTWRPDLLDPTEKALICQAVADVIGGASLAEVAAQWNHAGVKQNRQGGDTPRWTAGIVAQVLTRPRNIAKIEHDGETFKAEWPSIITEDERTRLLAAIARNRNHPVGKPHRKRHELSGVVFCGRCGARMIRGVVGTGRYAEHAWRCQKGQGREGCGRVSMEAERLEGMVKRAAFTIADTANLDAYVRANETGEESATLRAKLDALDAKLDELAEAFTTRGSARAYRMATERIDAEQGAIRKRLMKLSTAGATVNVLGSYAGKPGALEQAWPRLTAEQRREVLLLTLRRVTVMPSRKDMRVDLMRVVFGQVEQAQADAA